MIRNALVAAVALFGVTAFAQVNTDAQVRITGNTTEIVALSIGTPAMTNANIVADGAVDYRFDFGDMSAASAVMRAELPLTIRSNVAYEVNAVVTPAAANTFDASFVGFAINEVVAGTNVVSSATRGADAFYFTTSNVTDGDNDGVYDIVNSLADLAGDGLVMKGDRISARGSLNTPNNGIEFTTEFAVAPEMYTADQILDYTVVFTISPTP